MCKVQMPQIVLKYRVKYLYLVQSHHCFRSVFNALLCLSAVFKGVSRHYLPISGLNVVVVVFYHTEKIISR